MRSVSGIRPTHPPRTVPAVRPPMRHPPATDQDERAESGEAIEPAVGSDANIQEGLGIAPSARRADLGAVANRSHR